MTQRVLVIPLTVLLISCSGGKEHARPAEAKEGQKEHADEPSHQELPKKIRVAPSVIAAAKIRMEPAARKVLAATLSLPGEIAANPDKSAGIASPVAGRITRVLFQEGARVRKGAALVAIRVLDVENVQASYVTASTKAQVARANADRIRILVGKGLAAPQELLAAEAEAESRQAETQAAKAQLKTLGATLGQSAGSELIVRAPMNGTVVIRNAIVGQPVTANETLATLADLSEVWFLGRVFEKDLARLRIGALADVELNAYPGQYFSGKVSYIGRQIDPVARTVTARIPLINQEDLSRIGLFGTARIDTGNKAKKVSVLTVPQDAVTEIGQKPVVFVRHPDGDFEVHEIVLGESALGYVEVLSGLREGEAVVVDGAFTLKSLILKGTFAEEE